MQEYYSIFEYNNEILKSIIFNITKNIKNIVKSDYLFNYLNDVIKLNNYSITLDDMVSLFKLFDDYTAYINYNKNKEYKDFLNNSLITYYNESYTKLMNNYISETLLSNIDILISERIILQINLLENKLSDDYNYFILLIKKAITREKYGYHEEKLNLGGTTISSLEKFYDELKVKINETLNEHLEKYLFFNFDEFIRNKSKLFRERYLHFYSDNKNENKYNIFKLDKFIFEIIKEPSFNESLNMIFDNIFNKTLKDKINLKLNQNLFLKLNKFNQFLETQKKEMNKSLLEPIKTNSYADMNNINNIINKYNIEIKSFTSKYIFYFSNQPLLNINDFVNYHLKPPLTEIKNKYNVIEKELLDKSIEKLNNLDDFSSIIQNDLNLESKIINIGENIEIIKSNISEIIDFLFEEIDQYYCNLAYFKVIEGEEYLGKNNKINLCNASLYFLNHKTFRRLKEKDNKVNYNINKYFEEIPKLNNIKYNKLKRILKEKKEYSSDSPSLSKKDITFFCLLINETLSEFANDIMGEQLDLMILAFNSSINEIIYKIMPNLKFTIDFTEKKFNSILTEDNLKLLHSKMFYHYYKIENTINNYIKSITININSLFNAFNNSKVFFDLVNNLIYNIISEYSNKINQDIIKTNTITNAQSSNKRRMSNVIMGNSYYMEEVINETQSEFDEIEKKIGELYYIANDTINLLDVNNTEFLEIVDKDFKNNKNNSLINSIGKYILKKNNDSIPNATSYHEKLQKIAYSFNPFILPFCQNLLISFTISFDNIDIYLDIGEEYIYNDEDKDKETPDDMQIYQFFKIEHTSFVESYADIYIPSGLSTMYIEFGFNGVFSESTTNTNIRFNILNNTYSMEIKGNLRKKYRYFIGIGMKINLIFFSFWYFSYITDYLIIGSQYINFYSEYSFREPLFDNSALEGISYFSYSDSDLEQVKKLIEQNKS